MSEPTEEVVTSAAGLLALVELTDVVTYEIAGRRSDEDRPDEPEQVMHVSAGGGEDWIETRCRISIRTPEADLLADLGARFTAKAPFRLSQESAREFVQRVGVMSVFPYAREAIFATASRLGVSPPVIGLLRAGGFTIGTEPEDRKEQAGE